MSSLTSCFGGSMASEAKTISKEIERQLSKDRKQARSQVKLLVLGAAESGKSTFIKQMRIIHGKGYTEDEKRGYISLIHQNISISIKMLVLGMEKLGIPYEHEENRAIGERFLDKNKEEGSMLDALKARLIKTLWSDEGIQKCYLRRNEFHLFDSAAYYLDDIMRISSDSYLPTLQDILRTRLPTSGIIEYLFDVDRFIFGIVDVGGQKSERRKWIHCFENVTSIIFLAALSEYDQTIPSEEIDHDLRDRFNRLEMSSSTSIHPSNNNYRHNPMIRSHSEQQHKFQGRSATQHKTTPKKMVRRQYSTGHVLHSTQHSKKKGMHDLPPLPSINSERRSSTASPRKYSHRLNELSDYHVPVINRLTESCALFSTIVQNEYFKNMSVILFLNKKDILEEKVEHSHLVDHFPEFTGSKRDAEAAKNFISEKYGKCFDKVKSSKRTLYTHFTCATDTSNIIFVFAAIKDIILQSYLISYNLV